MISLDKKNLPKYKYKLNIALICFFALWFTVCVGIMITIGCIYGENLITYVVMISMFALFFIGLAIFYFLDIKFHKRLIKERTAELEKEFCDIPYEKAERILKEKEVISDTGFIVSEKIRVFDKEEIPFEKAQLMFDIFQVASHIELSIVMFTEENDKPKAVYDFDCAMYNFLRVKDENILNFDDFNLFVKDKGALVKLVLKDAKTIKFINKEKY